MASASPPSRRSRGMRARAILESTPDSRYPVIPASVSILIRQASVRISSCSALTAVIFTAPSNGAASAWWFFSHAPAGKASANRKTSLRVHMTFPSLRAQNFQVPRHGFDPAEEVRQVELLVGRVQVVVRQPEAHHDAGDAQVAVENSHDGNRPARADVHRLLAEDLLHGFGRRVDERVGGGGQRGRARA